MRKSTRIKPEQKVVEKLSESKQIKKHEKQEKSHSIKIKKDFGDGKESYSVKQDQIERQSEVIKCPPLRLGSNRKSEVLSHRANSIQTSLRQMWEFSKKAQSFGERAWVALDTEGKGYLTKKEIMDPIVYSGVGCHLALQELIQKVQAKPDEYRFELAEFQYYTSHFDFYKKVLQFDLVLHDFDLFAFNYHKTFNAILEDREGRYQGGAPADYIPTLAKAYPDYFASAFCSVHGQFIQVGDFEQEFSIQSIGKVVNYSFIYDLVQEEVHKYVGEEPSGQVFNAPVFDEKHRPHNPMINAGAIMTCAVIVKEGKGLKDLLRFYERATGTVNAKIDQELYEEERDTGYSNHALASLMLSNNAFPIYSSPEVTRAKADEALDLYFRACSLLVNVQSLAKFGAMLANNGVNPSTGERILKPQTVQSVVTIMTTCGMYNGAGKFVKELGIPSKSGVAGGLLSVVPGICAVATFSPKLNKEGNTVKGIGVMEKLGQHYKNFNLFHKDHYKRDILARPYETVINTTIKAIECSAIGDIEGLSRLYVLGVDLSKGDYDKRTPLHLAASKGNFQIVRYLVSKGVDLNCRDRWGSMALDDANSEELREFLIQNGAKYGNTADVSKIDVQMRQGQHGDASESLVTDDKYRLLYAARNNKLQLIKSLLINCEVDGQDYDMRTALGIAASEGHLETVQYLVRHGANIHHRDVWGNDPMEDAQRENRFNVVQYLQSELESKYKSE